MQSEQTVGQFFSHLSQDYDSAILRACPPYREVLDALLGYLFFPRAESLRILELGCGTGNLTRLLAETFPQAHITLVDLSAEMLAQAETKIQPLTSSYTLVNQGFMDLNFESGAFDLVISSLALHHLLDDERATLFKRMREWLKPGGVFRCADHCEGLPADAAQVYNTKRWISWSKSLGATDADIRLWEEHAVNYDHYASLAAHFRWLEDAGFQNIDCYWRMLHWAVFGAETPAAGR